MAVGLKRKRGVDEVVDTAIPPSHKSSRPTSKSSARAASEESACVPEDMEPQLKRIAESNRTAFEKKVVGLPYTSQSVAQPASLFV